MKYRAFPAIEPFFEGLNGKETPACGNCCAAGAARMKMGQRSKTDKKKISG